MTATTRDWLELSARLEPSRPARGTMALLLVEALIPEHGHIEAHEPPDPFLIPTVLEVAADDSVKTGPVVYPEAEERRFDWSPVVLQVLAGSIRFQVPVEIDVSAPEGRHTIAAQLRYQACTHGACLPPSTQSVEVEAWIES